MDGINTHEPQNIGLETKKRASQLATREMVRLAPEHVRRSDTGSAITKGSWSRGTIATECSAYEGFFSGLATRRKSNVIGPLLRQRELSRHYLDVARN